MELGLQLDPAPDRHRIQAVLVMTVSKTTPSFARVWKAAAGTPSHEV